MNDKNLDIGCRPDNTTNIDCNGRGQCLCGQCDCDARPNPEEVISGKFCECDNFSCDRHNGLLCSGSDRGTCVCGECVCKPGWEGSSCDCHSSNDTCYAPGSDVICSGHGTCECGACKCHITDEGRFSGKYCEKCPTCAPKCAELKDCVQCQMYEKGVFKNREDCLANCTAFVPISVKSVDCKFMKFHLSKVFFKIFPLKFSDDEEKDESLCTFFDEDKCRYQFVYVEDEENKIVVRAQEELECPPKVYMLGIILGVIAAIVLIGMAMLMLWKTITTISDRREFARFEKERMMAKWDTVSAWICG